MKNIKILITAILVCCLFSFVQGQSSKKHKGSNISMMNHSGNGSPDVTKGFWNTEEDMGEIHLTLQNSGKNNGSYFQIGSYYPIAEFKISTGSGRDRFEIVRPAGNMILVGEMEDMSGMGRYEFIPSNDFKSFLRTKGLSDISSLHMLKLFMGDCDEKYVNDLKKLYNGLTIKDLGKLSMHHVDISYIKSIRSEGYENMELNMMKKFFIHGVTPKYIQDLRKAGYDNIEPNMMKKFVIHDVTADYLKSLNALGLTDIEHNKIKKLAVNDISIQYIKEIVNTGIAVTNVKDLIKSRDHNLNARFIKNAMASGNGGDDLHDMIKYKKRGR